MALHRRRFALWGFVALLASGCKKEEKAPPLPERYDEPPQSPAAGEVANPVGDTRVRPYAAPLGAFPTETIDRIAAERCAREIRCGNVGPGKNYADLSACMADLRSKSKAVLDAYECKSGVNSKEVEQCLAQLRGEGCGATLGAIERMTACRGALLCSER